MPSLDELFTEMDKQCAVIAEDMLKKAPPPKENPLVPKEQIVKEAKTVLTEYLQGKDLRERIARGYQVIFRELKAHSTPVVIERIQGELEGCFNEVKKNTKNLIKETPKEEDAWRSFQEIYGISDETINDFYSCGFRLYEQKSYQEAADVFYVVSMLDYRRYNVWMSFGSAEKQLENWEQALIAFSMASLADMELPLPFIYSTECY